ncbi:MAG TPA: replication-relaxation family protein [Thermoanaerobaculia bacterium]|nr:replication-relaxation family protein [Thermoanaerobaculia bacterium]
MRGSFQTLFRIIRGESRYFTQRRAARSARADSVRVQPPAPGILNGVPTDQDADLEMAARISPGENTERVEQEVRDDEAVAPEENINAVEAELSRRLPEAHSPMLAIAREGAERPLQFATLDTASDALSHSASIGIKRNMHGDQDAQPRLLRDRMLILAVARCRLLSYQQIHTFVFGSKHRTVVGRRIGVLASDGWLRVWEERVPRGGHPRYALPTKKALRWARHVLLQEAADTPHARLAATMLRDPAPVPLELKQDVIPMHLAHQRETNDVVLALLQSRLPVTWASTWHRPFPNAHTHLALPQPDAVLVIGRHLLFVEHDRGHEALEGFRHAKAERYAALRGQRTVLESLTGFADFDVLVTIHASAPLQRIRALQQVVRSTHGASMFRFTLDTWLHEAPADPICFDTAMSPDNTSLLRTEHRGLVPIMRPTPVQAGETGLERL